MGSLSVPHLILLIFILLIFFGPSRLEGLGKSLGRTIRGFKDGLNEVNADSKDVGPQQQIRHDQQNPAQTQSQTTTETKKENS